MKTCKGGGTLGQLGAFVAALAMLAAAGLVWACTTPTGQTKCKSCEAVSRAFWVTCPPGSGTPDFAPSQNIPEALSVAGPHSPTATLTWGTAPQVFGTRFIPRSVPFVSPSGGASAVFVADLTSPMGLVKARLDCTSGPPRMIGADGTVQKPGGILENAQGLVVEQQTVSGGKLVSVTRGKDLFTRYSDSQDRPTLIAQERSGIVLSKTYFRYADVGGYPLRQRMTVQEFNSDGSNRFLTTLYVYYASDGPQGKYRKGSLWFVVEPEGVKRYLAAAGYGHGVDLANAGNACDLDNRTTVTDQALLPYAAVVYLGYDSQERITQVRSLGGGCCGGSTEGTYTFAYYNNGAYPGSPTPDQRVNLWKLSRRVTAPSGLRTVEFYNMYNSLLMEVVQEMNGNTIVRSSVTHYRYYTSADGFWKNGLVREERYPSACTGYTLAQSGGWTTDVKTKEDGGTGLVRLYDYDPESGQLVSEKVRQGTKPQAGGGNEEDWIRKATYVTHVSQPSHETGLILREVWTGIPGAKVSDLTGNANYPAHPTSTSYQTSFEAPTNIGDNYGTRMRGYLHPATTGYYTFWIASDDNSELWLSTNDTPGGKVKIASVPGWTNPREWGKYKEQKSATISLVGGNKYYIEALMKEAGGGDNLAVAWQVPNSSVIQVIDGGYLSPYGGMPTGGGTILREYWTGIPGAKVSDLTSNPDYLGNNPSETSEQVSFEAPTNIGDNYGTRMRGYLRPLTSGSYTFWIASDDNSELWLSTNDTPDHKVKIASVPGWTNPKEWGKYKEQKSATISLVGGNKYYIEALMKEAGGGDNLAVAWQGPDSPTRQVIPGGFLTPAQPGGPNSQKVRLVQDETIYPTATPNEYASDRQVTHHDYTFYAGSGTAVTNAVEFQTVTYPTVLTGHNGSGAATYVKSHFARDTVNNLYYKDWTRHEYADEQAQGVYSYTLLGTDLWNYGQAVLTIEDVQSGGGGDPPSGFTLPPNGLNLTTTYDYYGSAPGETGSYARLKSVTAPGGRKTVYAYESQEKIVSGKETTTSLVTLVAPEMDGQGNYNLAPVQITVTCLAGRTLVSAAGVPQTNTDDNLVNDWVVTGETLEAAFRGSISAKTVSNYNEKFQLESVDQYYDLAGGKKLTTAYTYNATTALLETATAPDGTINFTQYDQRGRTQGTWLGTNATGATQDHPDNQGAGGNNMKVISQTFYDQAVPGTGASGVGDGNVTQTKAFADGSTSYSTVYNYDWRDRLTRSLGPDSVAAVRDLDNLGRATESRTYAGATLSGSGVITVAAGNLRAQSDTAYDELGRTWQTVVYNVDPVSGTVGHTLTSNYWYDVRGRLVKTAGPNGLFSKTAYDSAGRTTAAYLSYDAAETSYADAATVSGDTVVEETRYAYDTASNVILSTHYQRTDTATLTGALDAGTIPNDARRTYAAAWFDVLGRTTYTADYGTNGDTDLTRPGTAPAPSADVIVTHLEYNTDTGAQDRTTDNAGKVVQRVFDALGRTRLVVENCTHTRSEVGLDFLPDAAESDTNRTTAYEFDAFGRLATLIAYNPKGEGNPVEPQKTRYVFATDLNRSWVAAVAYPDTSDPMSQDADKVWTITSGSDHVSITYDRLGRTVTRTDQRGVAHAYAFDAAGRFLADAVTLPNGSAVDGTVLRIGRTYDDVSRVLSVTSYDAATGGTAVNGLAFTFDGWGNVAKSNQNHAAAAGSGDPAVEYTYADGATGNDAKYVRLSGIIYPNSRQVAYSYADAAGDIHDRLSRVRAITSTDSTPVVYAQYTYLGGGTVVKAAHPAVTSGLDLTYKGSSNGAYDGFDRFDRVVDQRWTNAAGTSDLDRYKYGYDLASNRTWRENSIRHAAGGDPKLDEFYTYDNLQRLATSQRGTLTGGPPYTGISGTPVKEEDWTLDALGNWPGYVKKSAGVTDLNQTRLHNKVNEIDNNDNHADTPVGSIVGGSWVLPVQDAAGNMTSGPKPGAETTRIHMKYDAWNRMVEVRNDSGGDPGSLIITCRYDGLTRRIQKIVAGSPDVTYDYYYNEGRQVLETRKNSSTNPLEQFVWDIRYVHSPVLRWRDSDTDGQNIETLYYTNDANFNTTALVDTGGNIVERTAYDPYGKVTFYDGSWANPSSTSAYSNDILFTGHRLDAETGLYYGGARYYHPTLGLWPTRDPSGYVTEISLYGYVGSEPVGWVDFSGKGRVSTANSVAVNTQIQQPPEFSGRDLGGKEWEKAYFIHAVGNYWKTATYVGHSAIGCEDKDRLFIVFDYVGGGTEYRRMMYVSWVEDQVQYCPIGCKLRVDILQLAISKSEANALCNRLNSRNNLRWEWAGSGAVDVNGQAGHNCTSSLTEDMAATTSIRIPDKKVPAIEGLFTPTNTPRRWGKYTVDWLRSHGSVQEEGSYTYKCNGKGIPPDAAKTNGVK